MFTLDNLVNEEMYIEAEKISITKVNILVYFSTNRGSLSA